MSVDDASSIGSLRNGVYEDSDSSNVFDYNQPISYVKKTQYQINGAPLIGQGTDSFVINSVWKITGRSVALRIVSKEPLGYKSGRRGLGRLRLMRKEKAEKTAQRQAIETRRIRMRNEIAIISAVSEENNKNIVKFYDFFESVKNYYISTELLYGTDLEEELQVMTERTRRLSEDEAGIAASSILSGISHIHSKNIMHRDIRPKNIRYRYARDKSQLVITDFRYARSDKTTSKELDSDHPEDVRYWAPETLKGKGYWQKSSDVWSLGVILYWMLTGSLPCGSANDAKSVYKRIRNAEVILDKTRHRWKHISDSAHDITKSLLAMDPKERITTAEDALNHNWFKEKGKRSSSKRRSRTSGLGRVSLPELSLAERHDDSSKEARSRSKGKERAHSPKPRSDSRGSSSTRGDKVPTDRSESPSPLWDANAREPNASGRLKTSRHSSLSSLSRAEGNPFRLRSDYDKKN